MAYRSPHTLTCRICGKTGGIVWVVGAGPEHSGSQGPAYKTLKDAGPWREEATETHPNWAGRLFCPDCGEIVKRVPESTIRRRRGGVQE
jgi:hypothetical protein